MIRPRRDNGFLVRRALAPARAFITLIMCLTATPRGERDSPGIVSDTIVQLSRGFFFLHASAKWRRFAGAHRAAKSLALCSEIT